MTLRFVADVHIDNYRKWGGTTVSGVNRRCKEILDTLRIVAKQASDLYVLGDLFDKVKMDPQVIAATGDVLQNCRSYLLLGNHEAASLELDDNALSPLKRLSGVHVDEGHAVLREFKVNYGTTQVISIPFQNREALVYIPEELERVKDQIDKDKCTVVCFHAGIITADTPPFLVNSPDAINALILGQILESYNANVCIVGNWHNPKVLLYNKKNNAIEDNCYYESFDEDLSTDYIGIFQVGTLAPHSFSDADIEAGGVIEHNFAWKFNTEIASGPRFYKCSYPELDSLYTDPYGLESYIRITCTADEFAKAKVDALKYTTDNKNSHIDLVVEDEAFKEHVRAAAQAASKTSNLKEALNTYVTGLKLPKIEEKRVVEQLAVFLKV